MSRAWLAAALSSSTSSQAATHSALAGFSPHASSAFLMLSCTFSDILSGAAYTGRTTMRPGMEPKRDDLFHGWFSHDELMARTLGESVALDKALGVERLTPAIVVAIVSVAGFGTDNVESPQLQ